MNNNFVKRLACTLLGAMIVASCSTSPSGRSQLVLKSEAALEMEANRQFNSIRDTAPLVKDRAIPDWEKRIAGGNLKFMREFLRENVHRFGREFPALELIARATGSPLSPEPYISYLKNKYL